MLKKILFCILLNSFLFCHQDSDEDVSQDPIVDLVYDISFYLAAQPEVTDWIALKASIVQVYPFIAEKAELLAAQKNSKVLQRGVQSVEKIFDMFERLVAKKKFGETFHIDFIRLIAEHQRFFAILLTIDSDLDAQSAGKIWHECLYAIDQSDGDNDKKYAELIQSMKKFRKSVDACKEGFDLLAQIFMPYEHANS